MTPGPAQILRVPGCKELVKNNTTASGNTFGARFWIANSAEKRRYLRMRIWWCGNDVIREGISDSLSEEHLDNLREFAKLLPEDETNGRLMKAEVCRELGMFEESRQLLEFDSPGEMSATLRCIRGGVERGETRVMEVTSGEE